MSADMVSAIARAVLYEGYLLYPYRPSALKNQQRWNFGVLYPPAWAAQQTGSDRSYLQMECLALTHGDTPHLEASVKFLQVVPSEAIEREVQVADTGVSTFAFDDLLSGQIGLTVTKGDTVCLSSVAAGGALEPGTFSAFRLTLRVTNTSAYRPGDRDGALRHSLASAHVVLGIQGGDFVSQIDPPEELREAVAACQNTGVWPVLVGADGARDTMLGSPIILYDYPQVAPESRGDLFDSTEIDEILTLRILTLTDAEKEELRQSDSRARDILERLENSSPEELLALHGTMRDERATSGATRDKRPVNRHGGFQKGDRVRLHPGKRADIFDTLLEGKIAIIEAVEQDYEGKLHFAVVIEDDPGRDFGEMRQIGHRFFFSHEEIEAA